MRPALPAVPVHTRREPVRSPPAQETRPALWRTAGELRPRIPMRQCDRHRDDIPKECLPFFRHATFPTPNTVVGEFGTCRLQSMLGQRYGARRNSRASARCLRTAHSSDRDPRLFGKILLFKVKKRPSVSDLVRVDHARYVATSRTCTTFQL